MRVKCPATIFAPSLSPLRFLRIIVVLFAAFMIARTARAQITNVTGDQAPPIPGAGHNYIQMLNETVNPANGSVSIKIDVPVPSSRGFSVPFSFEYNSNSALHYVYPQIGWTDNLAYLGQAGWSYSVPQVNFTAAALVGNGGPPPPVCLYYLNYVFTDSSGSSHALGLSPVDPSGVGTCLGDVNIANPPQVLNSVLAGSDARVQAATSTPTQTTLPPLQVATTDGLVYDFSTNRIEVNQLNNNVGSVLPDWVEDRNGNKAIILDNGNGAFTITDTVGRTSVSSSGFGSTGNTVSLSGLSNAYIVNWSSQQSVTFTDSLAIVTSYYPNAVPSGCDLTATVNKPYTYQPRNTISSIQLPNQTSSYQFQYDLQTSLLKKVIYPTGGYIRYVWALSPTYWEAQFDTRACVPVNHGAVTVEDEQRYQSFLLQNRYVSFDGVNEVLEQDFTYSINWANPDTHGMTNWTQKQTTVVTKDLTAGTSFKTIYTYTPFIIAPQPNAPPLPGSAYAYLSTPVESQVQYYSTTGGLLRTEQMSYVDPQLPPDRTVMLDDNSTMKTHYVYGWGLNPSVSCTNSPPTSYGCQLAVVTDRYDYDYGLAPLHHEHVSYAGFGTDPSWLFNSDPIILDRPSQVNEYDGAGNSVAETDYSYDLGSVASVANLSALTHDARFGTSFNVRGNATTVKHRCLQSCSDAVTTYTYDETGQVLSRTDPCGNTSCSDMTATSHTSNYSYNDNYDSNPTANSNAYLTQITNPLGQLSKFKYAYSDGQLIQSQDQNDITAGRLGTGFAYADPLRRLTATSFPDAGGTTIIYNDTAPTPSVTLNRLQAVPHQYITSISSMDGLGHVTQTQLSTDPDGPTFTATKYYGTGLLYRQYNPTRCNPPTTQCAEATWGFTTTGYDALGRVTSVTAQDGSITTSSYAGRCVTVTDPANVGRKSCSDGLGRLTSVNEDPSGLDYLTGYSYDANNNLIGVVQNLSHQRSFTYDSLSRLVCASNPENSTAPCTTTSYTAGTTSYAYDANGNLQTKTAPAPNQTGTATVVTNYSYDALNRLTQKSYTGGTVSTPTATFTYDLTGIDYWGGISNPVGRLIRASVTGTYPAATYYDYDAMGRFKDQGQCAVINCPNTSGSNAWTTLYTYDLAGSMKSYSDPGGNVFTYTNDGAGRPTTLLSNWIDGNHPGVPLAKVDYNIGYWPNGAIRKMTLGNFGTPLTETSGYNNRLQPCHINVNSSGGYYTQCTDNLASSLLDFSYGYNPSPSNNGNVLTWAATGSANLAFNRSYKYDTLNRLFKMTESNPSQPCPGLLETYDAWGNRKAQANIGTTGNCTPYLFSANVNVNNNQLSSPYTYDAAGNMTYDGNHSYIYDAENRLVSVDLGTTAQYVYDANGRRVMKLTGAGTGSANYTFYIYDSDGNLLTERDANNNWIQTYIHFGSRLLAFYRGSGTGFIHPDHLGSTRLYTDQNGAVSGTPLDYDPFGVLAPGSTNFDERKFTGKERDAESGLDNFGARYNSSSIGRFMSPDPVGGLKVDPQTLNKYSYVRNNPVNLTDPTGLYTCRDDNNQCKSKQDQAFDEARRRDLNSKDPNVRRAAEAYGDPTIDNHVSVGFADLKKDKGETTSTLGADDKGNLYAQSDVTISSKLSGSGLDAAVGHEGSHVADAQDVVSSISKTNTAPYFSIGMDISRYASEQRAYAVSDSILRSENDSQHFTCGITDCILGVGLPMRSQLTDTVDRILAHSPIYLSGGKPLSPTNQGGSVVNGLPVVPK